MSASAAQRIEHWNAPNWWLRRWIELFDHRIDHFTALSASGYLIRPFVQTVPRTSRYKSFAALVNAKKLKTELNSQGLGW
ncbi:MAG: hypothetical protein HEQ39_18850 [Rhizobacter sp.]